MCAVCVLSGSARLPPLLREQARARSL